MVFCRNDLRFRVDEISENVMTKRIFLGKSLSVVYSIHLTELSGMKRRGFAYLIQYPSSGDRNEISTFFCSMLWHDRTLHKKLSEFKFNVSVFIIFAKSLTLNCLLTLSMTCIKLLIKSTSYTFILAEARIPLSSEIMYSSSYNE